MWGGRQPHAHRAFSKRKRFTIEWCLFQTLREQERGRLAKAHTIAVAMDEREDRLLVTYAACAGTDVPTGVLAQLRNPSRSADAVAFCVQAAVRRFCTNG